MSPVVEVGRSQDVAKVPHSLGDNLFVTWITTLYVSLPSIHIYI